MDNTLFASIYSYAFKGIWFDTFIILFAAYWQYVVVVVLLLFLWAPKFKKTDLKTRTIHTSLAVFSALLARFGPAVLVRNFYPRERPFVFEGINALINQDPLEASFPSGNATFFMALAVYFFLAGYRKLSIFLFVSTLIISVARVAAGVHWPSDILAGWITGAIVSWAVFKLVRFKKI